MYGFPLWGKLSPQVTDEGATTGRFPLIRRVPRHHPPKGKAFVLRSPRRNKLRKKVYNFFETSSPGISYYTM